MTERLKVLVVDDDVVDRMAVRRALTAANRYLDVLEVDTCAATLAALRDGTVDAVFLDFLLPDGDGLHVIHEARGAGIRTPIVILTGQGDEETAVELMKAGASDYLSKSQLTPDRLYRSLQYALRLHQAERQAEAAERERARLLGLERAARAEAEETQRRFAFLAEASTLLASSLDYETTLTSLAKLAIPHLADSCSIDVVEDEQWVQRVAVADADGDAGGTRLRFRHDEKSPAPILKVLRTGAPELASSRDVAPDAARHDVPADATAYMIVPLIARGRTLGAISFLSRESGRRYGPRDLELAEDLAGRAALAVDNARLYREAKRAEEEVRRQLDFTTAVARNLAEGVCALDRDGRFTFLNPAAEVMLGRRAPELVGRPLQEALRLGDVASAATSTSALAKDVFGLGRIVRREDDVLTCADGRSFPVSFSLSPIVSGGEVVGAVLAFRDTSERKRAERELEASRRQVAMSEKLSALGTLVSGVAHEIRTPLTYLTNNLFLLKKRIAPVLAERPEHAPVVADTERFVAAALDGVERINALVRNLRTFASPDQGRRVQAGLHEVVADAVELFRATQRGYAEVEVELRPTRPLVLDKQQVARAVINLLTNAVEAMPRGGTVRVATRNVPGGAEIEVHDEGTGIPPEVQARLFDPFFTTKAEGTGLGLSITRRIVDVHGGRVRYETVEGRGTRFVLFLPEGGVGREARAAVVPGAAGMDITPRPAERAPAPPARDP